MPEQTITPQTIAEEYLRPDKSTEYKANALTLLRVLGGGRNAKRLAEEAVENEEPVLRRRAVDEIRNLTGGDRAEAVVTLRKIVAEDSSGRRGLRAYAALGVLGEGAGSVPSLFRRVRLESRLHEEVYPSKNWQFHTRTLWAAVIAASLAAALTWAYLSAFELLRSLNDNVVPTIVFASLGAALLTAPILTIRSIDFGSHVNRTAGVLAECFWVVSAALGIDLVGLLLVPLTAGEKDTQPKITFARGVFTLGVMAVTVVVIRLGAIVTRPGAASRKPRLLWSTLSAGSMGALVFTGLLLLNSVLHSENLFSGYYATFIPAIFGIAGAFSVVDARTSANRPRWKWSRTILGSLAILAFGVLLVVPLMFRSKQFGTLKPGQENSVLVKRLPEVLTFTLTENAKVFIKVATDGASSQAASSVNPSSVTPSGVLLDWSLRNPGREDVYPTRGSLTPSGFGQNLMVDAKFGMDLKGGEYSLSVIDRLSATTQAAIFSAVFAFLIHPHDLPPIHASIFVSESKLKPDTIESLPDGVPVPITQVPFVSYIKVTKDRPFVDIHLLGHDTFSPGFQMGVYDGARQILASTGTRLDPKSYRVVVDQAYNSDPRKAPIPFGAPAPLPRVDRDKDSNPRITTLPEGLKISATTFALSEASKPTVIPANTPTRSFVSMPTLPGVHVIKVEGGSANLSFGLDYPGQRVAVTLKLYDEGGLITRIDPPLSNPQALEPGTYWLIASFQDDDQVTPSGTGPNGEPVYKKGKPAGNMVLTIATNEYAVSPLYR